MLAKSLHVRNHKTLGAALFGLSLIGEDAEWEIAELDRYAPVAVRCAMALALGLSGSSKGEAELIKMFTDEEANVRWSVTT